VTQHCVTFKRAAVRDYQRSWLGRVGEGCEGFFSHIYHKSTKVEMRINKKSVLEDVLDHFGTSLLDRLKGFHKKHKSERPALYQVDLQDTTSL